MLHLPPSIPPHHAYTPVPGAAPNASNGPNISGSGNATPGANPDARFTADAGSNSRSVSTTVSSTTASSTTASAAALSSLNAFHSPRALYALSALLCILLLASACKRTEQKKDELYSRHLQRQVTLTIINTPVPSDRTGLNLLILNDGQDLEKMRIPAIVDSLYKKGLLQPLVIVGVHAGDRTREYGLSGFPDYAQRGARANFYEAFINDELYPYAKKQAGVRKFSSVAIAGWSLGGLSAFDIAWNHPEKISRIGAFSAPFQWSDKDPKDSTYANDQDRILLTRLKASRKKPRLQYWLFAGDSTASAGNSASSRGTNAGSAGKSSTPPYDGPGPIFHNTRDLIRILEGKNLYAPADIVFHSNHGDGNDPTAWSAAFPGFLLWAFGK